MCIRDSYNNFKTIQKTLAHCFFEKPGTEKIFKEILEKEKIGKNYSILKIKKNSLNNVLSSHKIKKEFEHLCKVAQYEMEQEEKAEKEAYENFEKQVYQKDLLKKFYKFN